MWGNSQEAALTAEDGGDRELRVRRMVAREAGWEEIQVKLARLNHKLDEEDRRHPGMSTLPRASPWMSAGTTSRKPKHHQPGGGDRGAVRK